MERDRKSDAERMAEAANRPLDFQPKERAQYVRDSITQIETYLNEGMTTEEIKEKIPVFVKSYKNLFEMVTHQVDTTSKA